MGKNSPARDYASGKSLTKRRSRSAQFIEGYMLRSRKLFVDLMQADERRMRAVLESWPLPPTERGYQPPLRIGNFALLAYPGTLLETVQEDQEQRQSQTRLLIKVTVNGTIFNLVCKLRDGVPSWTWNSQEFNSSEITADQIASLKMAIMALVDLEIPRILEKLKTVPV